MGLLSQINEDIIKEEQEYKEYNSTLQQLLVSCNLEDCILTVEEATEIWNAAPTTIVEATMGGRTSSYGEERGGEFEFAAGQPEGRKKLQKGAADFMKKTGLKGEKKLSMQKPIAQAAVPKVGQSMVVVTKMDKPTIAAAVKNPHKIIDADNDQIKVRYGNEEKVFFKDQLKGPLNGIWVLHRKM